MKKCFYFGLAMVLTALSFQTFAVAATETNGTVTETEKSVANDKYVIFTEDFQGMKEYNQVIGDYNKDNNISVPTGWASAQTAAFNSAVGGAQGNAYTDYWNENTINSFMSDSQFDPYTRGIVHMQNNAGGIDGNIALSLTATCDGAASGANGVGSQQAGIVKYFPNGVAAGNFTLEFDILVGNEGKWALGLIPYDNYDAAVTFGTYGGQGANLTSNKATDRANTYGRGGLLTNRAKLSYVIGQMTSDSKVYVPKSVGLAYDTNNFTPLKDNDGKEVTLTNTVKDNDYTKTEFNHIKMEFDLYSGVHKVTITDKAKGTTNTYNWQDSAVNRFEKGVMGITLQKYGDGTVSDARVVFDNIEVYKNNAYFINQDFSGYTQNTQVPGGWYMAGSQLAKAKSLDKLEYKNSRVASTAGPSGKSDDYALKITAVKESPQDNIFMSLFTRPAYGGHPISVEFDLKSSKDTSWQLHQIDQEYIFAMKGYNYDGGAEQHTSANDGNVYYANASARKLIANNAILGYSGWNNTKDIAANDVISAKSGVKGNTYRTGDSSGQGLDITYGEYSVNGKCWAYTEGVNLKTAPVNGTDFSYGATESDTESNAEEKWNHYRVTVVPKADGSGTDYEIAIWPSGKTETEAGDSAYYGYASSTRNSVIKPMCGVGFLALSDKATAQEAAEGYIEIDNLKVYEASARVGEDEVTYYDEVTKYNNAAIEGVNVEYADGTVDPLNDGDVINKAAKRLVVKFSEPVATRAENEIGRILNRCMTSTATGVFKPSEWKESDKQYFKVFDSVEEAIKLRRNYSVADRNINTLPVTKTYLAANRRAYYIELDDKMFTENKEYVLTVSPNITFENSAYSMLQNGLELHFGVETGEGFEYNKISVVKQSDKTKISTLEELKKELTDNNNELTVLVNGANTISEDITLKLIAAQYTGEGSLLEAITLSDAVLEPGFVKDKEYKLTLNSDKVNDAGMDMLRCFLWKLDGIAPISDKVEIGQ